MSRATRIPSPRLAAPGVVLLAIAVLFPALSAHGLDMKAVVEEAAIAAGQDPEGAKKSPVQRGVERLNERAAGAATDRIMKKGKAAGKKGLRLLERTKKLGSLTKKMTRRYGPAVRRGARLAGPVGRALDSYDVAHTAGKKLISPLIVGPMIDRHFERQWEGRETRLRDEIQYLRQRGERRREHKERLTTVIAVGRAMRMLEEERRRKAGLADEAALTSPERQQEEEERERALREAEEERQRQEREAERQRRQAELLERERRAAEDYARQQAREERERREEDKRRNAELVKMFQDIGKQWQKQAQDFQRQQEAERRREAGRAGTAEPDPFLAEFARITARTEREMSGISSEEDMQKVRSFHRRLGETLRNGD